MRAQTSWSVLALVFGLLLLPFARHAVASSTVSASSAAGSLSASAAIDVAVNIPKVIEMQLLAHPSTIDVTTQDVARGHVTITGAAIKLVVNNPRGFNLRTDLLNAMFTAVRIAGLPAQVVATRAASLVHMPSMVGRPRAQPASVEYELDLAPGAQPGRYAWPVALSLQEP